MDGPNGEIAIQISVVVTCCGPFNYDGWHLAKWRSITSSKLILLLGRCVKPNHPKRKIKSNKVILFHIEFFFLDV